MIVYCDRCGAPSPDFGDNVVKLLAFGRILVWISITWVGNGGRMETVCPNCVSLEEEAMLHANMN